MDCDVLLIWINLKPNMDKKLHPLYSVEWNCAPAEVWKCSFISHFLGKELLHIWMKLIPVSKIPLWNQRYPVKHWCRRDGTRSKIINRYDGNLVFQGTFWASYLRWSWKLKFFKYIIYIFYHINHIHLLFYLDMFHKYFLILWTTFKPNT